MRKKHGPLRADTLRQSMNAGKQATVLRFIRDYRNLASQLGRLQWRLFFETGATNKQAPAKHLNSLCGAASVQMASYQAQEQIDGWVSNRANEFIDRVRHSSLPDAVRQQLYKINRRGLWFSREAITGVDDAAHTLARSIMRHCMGKHRKPDLSHVSPRLDSRIAVVAKAKDAPHADLWARLALPNRGAVLIPLHGDKLFHARGGELCPVVQLCTDDANKVSIRLVQDMTKPFAGLRADYEPKVERLGMDFGLATLMATSEGTMFGRGLIADLTRMDRQLAGIARHRQRSGGKARDSLRYRGIVTRLRGMLKTRINAALNRIVAVHAPAELAVERLDFRFPNMSRRMNRLITNCGRAVFRAKLTDLRDKFGIAATEENAAYTSQECSLCRYVDARNRRSQSKFTCRWCGSVKHANVDASRSIAKRRSLGLGTKWVTKAAILGALVKLHIERFPRSLGTAADPRMDNPYFRKWARGTRMLETQGLVLCA